MGVAGWENELACLLFNAFLSELILYVVQVNSYILHSLIWWVSVVVPMSRV